ncbi:MAG: hypothetical protein V7678_14030 [Brevundimonas sp.]
MTTPDRTETPDAEAPNDREGPEDTTPEIAADDAGASAMAERKAKEMARQAKS